ncbi:hypothetical protein Tco_0376913, partial [Tanacetum coccineum]
MIEGSTNDESYVSEFAESILNNEGVEVDDTRSKIVPVSQKENPEHVSDDDEIEKEKEVAQDMQEKKIKEVGTDTNVETKLRMKQMLKLRQIRKLLRNQ